MITYESKVITKNVLKINVEQTKGNGRSYPYLYPIGNLIQRSSIKASMYAPTKEVF
jgi:hypothetical protein